MAFDKSEVMNWGLEDRRNFAFELLDSIDEETIRQPLPEWKEKLIKQRIENDKRPGDDVVAWSELRQKYKHRLCLSLS